MPAESRALTNDYKACRLVRLDSDDPKSPLVVMQEGYDPGDSNCRMRLFYLQRDGLWIDEVARSTRPDNEAGDIVFESTADAVQTISGLFGKPLIRRIPVSETDIQSYLARVKGGNPEELLRQFLARHRASQGKL